MRKIFLATLAVMIAFSILAGCTGAPASQGTTAAAATTAAATAAQTTQAAATTEAPKAASVIRFMTWEGETMNNAILDTFDVFMKDNPDIKVELEPSPLTDYGIKLQEMLAAKIAPDVFMAGNDMALNYDFEGLVLDLKSYMDTDKGFSENFYPGTLTTYTRDGRIVGLPGLINLYGYFYNKKYFDEAGLTYPKRDWTYDDFFMYAEALSDKATNRAGIFQKGHAAFICSLYSASKDDTPFTDSIYPVTQVYASNSFKEGVSRMAEAIKAGYVTSPTVDDANVTANFMQGAIPMLRYGQWAADEIIRNAPEDLDWGFVPSPRVNKNAQILDAVGWCINVETADPEAAFQVLKFIESETYKVVLAQTPVAPPAYQPAASGYYDILGEKGHSDLAEGLDYMLDAEIKVPVRFLDSWSSKANLFLDADWNAFITGDKDVNEIQSAIIDPINEVIQDAMNG